MSTPDGRPIHPSLVDALEPEAADAVALDALARRLGELGSDLQLGADAPAGLFDAIEARAASGSTVVAMRPRRLVLGALAAAAALVVVVGSVVVLRDGDPEPITEEVVLGGLAGFEEVAGGATVVIDGDQRTVAVELADVDVPVGHHLELWLLDADVEQIIPLGELSSTAPHDVPPEVDLGSTPVLDVSLEPDDGDPAHSGVSVVRGTITAS